MDAIQQRGRDSGPALTIFVTSNIQGESRRPMWKHKTSLSTRQESRNESKRVELADLAGPDKHAEQAHLYCQNAKIHADR